VLGGASAPHVPPGGGGAVPASFFFASSPGGIVSGPTATPQTSPSGTHTSTCSPVAELTVVHVRSDEQAPPPPQGGAQ
jgi:hypothetical protein